MDFFDIVQARYSVRNYATKPVEDEKLQKILEAGRLSPTAANHQPQKIYVLKSKETMAKLRSVTRMAFNAPMAFLICYDDTISGKVDLPGDFYDSGHMDAIIVSTTMMYQATELGLGTLWVRGYNKNDIAAAFELPENIKLINILLVGYVSDATDRRSTSRKPLTETTIVL